MSAKNLSLKPASTGYGVLSGFGMLVEASGKQFFLNQINLRSEFERSTQQDKAQ